MIVILYIAVIVIANIVTANLPPIEAGPFLIPAGTLFVGLAFILRDFTQLKLGKSRTYTVILIALMISAMTSATIGDPLHIVIASAAAFTLSETVDTEIFSRWKGSLSSRVALSGIMGGMIDSTVFVILGLSPIGIGAISWELVPLAIAGQLIAKTILAYLGGLIVQIIESVRART